VTQSKDNVEGLRAYIRKNSAEVFTIKESLLAAPTHEEEREDEEVEGEKGDGKKWEEEKLEGQQEIVVPQ
jgi:hypothetical protein